MNDLYLVSGSETLIRNDAQKLIIFIKNIRITCKNLFIFCCHNDFIVINICIDTGSQIKWSILWVIDLIHQWKSPFSARLQAFWYIFTLLIRDPYSCKCALIHWWIISTTVCWLIIHLGLTNNSCKPQRFSGHQASACYLVPYPASLRSKLATNRTALLKFASCITELLTSPPVRSTSFNPTPPRSASLKSTPVKQARTQKGLKDYWDSCLTTNRSIWILIVISYLLPMFAII